MKLTELSGPEGQPEQRNGSRRRKSFNRVDFDSLHEQVGNLDFTPDFNPALEAIVADSEGATLPERLLALVKLQAWGNQSILAVHDDARTTPFTRADAVVTLGASRTRVYAAADALVARNLLRIEGPTLYPVPDPAAEKRRKEDAKFPDFQYSRSPNLRLWLENDHPDLLEQYQEATRTLNKIRAQFRADLRSRTSGKNDGSDPGSTGAEFPEVREVESPPSGTFTDPSLYRKKKVKEESSSSEVLVPPETAPRAPGLETTTTMPPPHPKTEAQAEEAVSRIHATYREHDRTADRTLAVNTWIMVQRVDPSAAPEEICDLIHEYAPRRGRSFGYVLTCIESKLPLPRDRKLERATTPHTADDPALQRWRLEQEAALNDPNVSEQEKHLIRLCLGTPNEEPTR